MNLVILSVVLIVLFVWLIREVEKRGVYMPTKRVPPPPAGWEEVFFDSGDGKRLSGWFVPAAGARLTLLFLHGNAGNVGHRVEKLKMLWALPANVFIIDYRGYGKSEGSPSEKGVNLDALAAYRWLTDELKFPASSIVVYGESLGAAVAVELALKRPAAGLIIEGAFTSVEAIAREIPPFHWLPSVFFNNKFDTLAKIGRVAAPKLFLHSENDEIIPFAMGQALFAAAAAPKSFAALSGGHNTAFFESGHVYLETIRAFLAAS